jgi:hypothetical protein
MPREVVARVLFSCTSWVWAAPLRWMRIASLELSIRDAVLTVSPKRQSIREGEDEEGVRKGDGKQRQQNE